MQQKKRQKFFRIVVVLDTGKTKTVPVQASERAVAERRALKRTGAVDISRAA